MATVSKRQLERRTGMARLESEKLRSLIATLRADLERPGRRRSAAEILDLVSELETGLDALTEALDVPVGLSVGQTASRLGVSEPTVRKWLAEGLLDAVPARKPIEVSQDSLVRLEALLARVSEALPERNMARALAVYLHDRALLDEDWVAEGIAAFRRGEFEPV